MSGTAGVIAAIKAGDFYRLRDLISADPSLAGARDQSGVSALMLALYHRRGDMAEAIAAATPGLDIFEAAGLGRGQRVEALLAADPKLVNAWSADGFTALHLACFFGQEEVARLLLERGADVAATARNTMKVQPLHSAAASHKTSIVKMLLEHGAPPDGRQQMGWTALHEAAHHGGVEMAQVLLAHGADPRLANDEGKTAASLAEAQGHKQMLELLQQEAGRG